MSNIRLLFGWLIVVVGSVAAVPLVGEPALLLKQHCGECHNDTKAKGKFRLRELDGGIQQENYERWQEAMELVVTREMPPEDEAPLSDEERERLVASLRSSLDRYAESTERSEPGYARRLNNREFVNSVRDVLLLEDIGTHQPAANLIGDGRFEGFDTHGETLGFSRFHLEQYLVALRKIVDAVILEGERPAVQRYEIGAEGIVRGSLSQNTRRAKQRGKNGVFDFLDPRLPAYFEDFEIAPTTGYYKIRVRATGKDRYVYDAEATGVYPEDPIRLQVRLGDRERVFELPDEEVTEIELEEWIAAGSRLLFYYPTDGLRFQGNGNFKFQYRIAHNYLKENDRSRYERVVREIVPKAPRRTAKNAAHWSHWVSEWEGARPQLFGALIEGPYYHSWPPKRQMALIGTDPKAADAAAILRPIAARAWRREPSGEEFQAIVDLVQAQASVLSDIGALKEGIVAILASPSFLFVSDSDVEERDRFATKLSLFLRGTIQDRFITAASSEGRLDSFEGLRGALREQFQRTSRMAFLSEFPQSWLQLDRINFMAPDPDRYPLYHRKRLSEDMIAEVEAFFRYQIEHNLPLTEFLGADYSFLNADLARVYGVSDVPQDSQLRKYTYGDGRRGGLLGMGAFLTLTADSLATSPIHRAVYVMENFLGIHPSPPPADVTIEEPDVRQAKTIKQVLAKHIADPNCATCHERIDPYGYAFENFDPVGSWRDAYTEQIERRPSRAALKKFVQEDKDRQERGLPPLPRPWEKSAIPVDASAEFPDGKRYRDIREFREHLLSETNRDRFVRCFIKKLLLYANGVEPTDPVAIEQIVAQSAAHEYRIIDTIAAVIDSALFRQRG